MENHFLIYFFHSITINMEKSFIVDKKNLKFGFFFLFLQSFTAMLLVL